MPGRTYSIVLEDEQNHRTVRRVTNVSEAVAHDLIRVLDGAGQVGTAAVGVMSSLQQLGKALEPIFGGGRRPRRIAPRRSAR